MILSDIKQIFYILCLNHYEREEHLFTLNLFSIGLNKDAVTFNGRYETTNSYSRALSYLIISVVENTEKEFFNSYDTNLHMLEYFFIDTIEYKKIYEAQELFDGLISLFKSSAKYNFEISSIITKEIAQKILTSLEIEIIEPSITFEQFLNKYNFVIKRPFSHDKINECKQYYPFNTLLARHKMGKRLPINDDEMIYYGFFSQEICDHLQKMFDDFIDNLISLEHANMNDKLHCIVQIKDELDKFNQDFKSKNGHYLMDEVLGFDDLGDVIILIAETARLDSDKCYEIFADWGLKREY